jgi:hypothetical protein
MPIHRSMNAYERGARTVVRIDRMPSERHTLSNTPMKFCRVKNRIGSLRSGQHCHLARETRNAVGGLRRASLHHQLMSTCYTWTVGRRQNASRRGVAARRPRAIFFVALGLLTGGVVVAFAGPSAMSADRSRAQFAARSQVAGQFEYVVTSGAIYVYSIDEHNRLVQRISVPQIDRNPHGVVASPATGMLYVSYGGKGGASGTGSLLAFDLRRNRVAWVRNYAGIDSMAISPDGRKIYMPAGEVSGERTWSVIDAATGNVGVAIHAGTGPHDTIMGPGGKYVYLALLTHPWVAGSA